MKSLAQWCCLFFLIVFVAGCGKSDTSGVSKDKVSFLYRSGVQKYEVGDYDSALSYFEKALQLDPKHESALLDVGILYEDYKKETSKAMDAYQQYLLLHPDGKKAEMVKGWLMKLAVNSGVDVVLPEKGETPKQGALLEVNSKTLEENKKLRKEIDALKAKIKDSKQALSESENILDRKNKALSKELDQVKEKVTSLEGELSQKSDTKEKESSKLIAQLQAKLKQQEIRQIQGKQDLLKSVEVLQKRIREFEVERKELVKGEEGVAASLDRLKKEKEELESDSLRSKDDLQRLKEAFATATEERARLNSMLQEKDGTIGALKGLVAKSAQSKAFKDSERKAFERQIALLRQKIKILEQDRKNYMSMIKTAPPQFKEPSETVSYVKKPVSSTSAPVKQPSRDYELVTYHRVKRGETLMMIAGYGHIYGERGRWKIIYEANKTNIDDPNVLVPGQILLVPR